MKPDVEYVFDFVLVVIEAILYEGAVAIRASVNFRKDLRGSKPFYTTPANRGVAENTLTEFGSSS